MSYRDVLLSKLTLKVQNWNPRKDAPEGIVDYIDISSIDRDLKIITEVSKVIGEEAPSRARQLVKSNDVLVSTVRPNLNAVAYVPQDLDGATASTGYCVLRCDPNRLDSRYLYHWVRTQQFIDLMVLQSTGANYPAVSDKIVKSSEIPLPPLDEQRRIAAILDQADRLRTLRREALAKLDSLLQATFLDMFGDPVTNPMGWEIVTLDDVCTKITDGVHKTPTYVEKGIPFISTVHISKDGIDWSNTKYISQDEHEMLIKRCKPEVGDILYTKVGSVGLALPIIEEKEFSIFVQLGLLKLKKDIVDPLFLADQLNTPSVYHRVNQGLTGATMKYISISSIRAIRIILPSLNHQQTYRTITDRIQQQKILYQQSLTHLDNLFHSLQQRAFRGELSERSVV